jgi:hypothetical protein
MKVVGFMSRSSFLIEPIAFQNFDTIAQPIDATATNRYYGCLCSCQLTVRLGILDFVSGKLVGRYGYSLHHELSNFQPTNKERKFFMELNY